MAFMKKVSGLTYADFLQLPEDNTRRELVDGTYVERATAKRAESVTVEHPFPVTICPTDLIA